ncbi:rifin [Plasmodium reichenowi]|uniref:Rifin n=1 Tax=Plasmodium reichenowi TaxID=5854 RepID=A0A060RM71_PLARE|nr:rifin [Plasmodium reichenowi]
MKQNYTKILLFFLLLNILAHNNKNKPSITPRHTPIYISRVLSECDMQSSRYVKDADIKSLKENFDRQSSQRFEEYEERMKGKRQKHKEERDKNIQKIIEKDKMEKSLTEKIEKGCLRCGCGLGGVAASVGLFGGLGIYGWKTAATTAAIAAAKEAGIEAGVQAVIAKIKDKSIFSIYLKVDLSNFINRTNYNSIPDLVKAVNAAMDSSGKKCIKPTSDFACSSIFNGETSFGTYVTAGKEAAASKTATVKSTKLGEVAAESSHLFSAIGYSILAILIIVLVMIIIYLVLRYRRKKKMNKKAKYTKLLNQ